MPFKSGSLSGTHPAPVLTHPCGKRWWPRFENGATYTGEWVGQVLRWSIFSGECNKWSQRGAPDRLTRRDHGKAGKVGSKQVVLPSGKLSHNYGKSPFFTGKLTINGDFP